MGSGAHDQNRAGETRSLTCRGSRTSQSDSTPFRIRSTASTCTAEGLACTVVLFSGAVCFSSTCLDLRGSRKTCGPLSSRVQSSNWAHSRISARRGPAKSYLQCRAGNEPHSKGFASGQPSGRSCHRREDSYTERSKQLANLPRQKFDHHDSEAPHIGWERVARLCAHNFWSSVSHRSTVRVSPF